MIFLTQVYLQLSDLSPLAIIELSKLFKSTMPYMNMAYSSKCKMTLFEMESVWCLLRLHFSCVGGILKYSYKEKHGQILGYSS